MTQVVLHLHTPADPATNPAIAAAAPNILLMCLDLNP
jgi:hypothetical protein